MEDDLKKNGRQPQKKMEDDLQKFLKMEDDLKKIKNGTQPQKINGR